MYAFKDPATKPSRVNRKRKKRKLSFVKTCKNLYSIAAKTCENLQKPAIQSARIGSYKPESLAREILPVPMSSCLTNAASQAIIPMPLTHSAAGICNPFTPGLKMTAPLAVFLCLPFSTALGCVYSMVGCIGQPLKRLAAPGCGIANPVQSTAQRFATLCGGLFLFTRMHRMSQNTHTQNQQVKTVSLFNVFLHRQLLAPNISGAKAERIKRRNPACIVKFSGFEVAL